LPDYENECQQSVKDFWPRIIVNQSAMWPLMAIYKVVTGSIGENAQYHLAAAMNMNKIVVVLEAVTRTWLIICL